MLWNDDLVAKPVEQLHGLNTHLLVIEVRELIAKQKNPAVRKRAIFVGVNLVPPTQRNLVELRDGTPLGKTREPLKQIGCRRICHQKVKHSRRNGSQSHGARESADKTRTDRHPQRIGTLLEPFSLKTSHVDVGRALCLAALAR